MNKSVSQGLPKSLWRLDPKIVYLNHGSFGACPREILQLQSQFRDELEDEPVVFMIRNLEPRLDAAREALAPIVGASTAGLGFVPNTTTGVNAILRSFGFQAGDELLTTNHVYAACGNALDFVAGPVGAKVVRVDIPYPNTSREDAVQRVLDAVTPRTRIALLDHITSPTGVVLPVEELVPLLEARGVATIVDGAHGPGMLDLNLSELDASWYVANCHKWLCAPKGSAFIYTSERRRETTRPVTISHGASFTRGDRSKYHMEFDWPGTVDFTPVLCLPRVLEFFAERVPGGWPGITRRNRELALAGRSLLSERLGWDVPCPDEMIGSLVAFEIPAERLPDGSTPNSLHDEFFDDHSIEILVSEFPPKSGRMTIRASAALYNDLEDFERLAEALPKVLRD